VNIRQITVRTPDGDYACPGAPSRTPGLYVVYDTTATSGPFYSVTHTSGIAAGNGFKDAESALAAANALGPLLDWTGTAMDIHVTLAADHGLVEEIVGIVLRWGGDYSGAPATPERIRELSTP
jgi:hypothetical protein